jgi:hypothetical protein
VRLDHLLSKELLDSVMGSQSPDHPSVVVGSAQMAETLADRPGRQRPVSTPSTTFPSSGRPAGVGCGGGWWVRLVLGLFHRASCWVLKKQTRTPVGLGVVFLGRPRLTIHTAHKCSGCEAGGCVAGGGCGVVGLFVV